MDNLWWLKVPNAISLINCISDALLEENNILLYHEHPIPWRYTFVRLVKEYVRENNSSKVFEMIKSVSNPGKYLLDEYCKAEKRATYRPSKGYAAFFAESDDIVIHNKFFWVLMDNSEEINAWISFVSDYYKHRPDGKETATFILECSGDVVPNKRKGINIVNIDDYINEYDKTVFATLLAAELDEPVIVKNYLTELMTCFAGSDIELMAEIINCYSELIERPYETLRDLAFSFVHTDGSQQKLMFGEAEIEHFVWKSQIKILYPLIEEYRKGFVERHSSDIKTGLPIESADGEQIFEPEEVELGGLVYLTGIKTLLLSEREYDRLVMFRDARNKLSHLGTLSWANIKSLFNIK